MHRDGASSRLFDLLFQRKRAGLTGMVMDADVRAGPGQYPAYLAADAARPARDHGHPAAEVQ